MELCGTEMSDKTGTDIHTQYVVVSKIDSLLILVFLSNQNVMISYNANGYLWIFVKLCMRNSAFVCLQ